MTLFVISPEEMTSFIVPFVLSGRYYVLASDNTTRFPFFVVQAYVGLAFMLLLLPAVLCASASLMLRLISSRSTVTSRPTEVKHYVVLW